MTKLISVIVGWENAGLPELNRAERMLARLGAQMDEAARELDLSAELIVLYDSNAVDPAVPKGAITSQIYACPWPGTVAFVPAPGARYYERKNMGATLAKGEILVFLDSDVVPDEGWLRGLLAALDNPQVCVVGGETYHETETPYDKLFAAFWMFAPKRPPRGLYCAEKFFANNMAVRRHFFLVHPFPDAAAYRGQCAELARSLRKQGFDIYRQSCSAVAHPPPQAGRSLVVRALWCGHDAVYWKRRDRFGALFLTNPVVSLWRWVRQLSLVPVKIALRARAVGLGPLDIPAAIAMGFAYYSCELAGELIAFFAPGLIRKKLSV